MTLKLEEFLLELISKVRNDDLSPEMTNSLTNLYLVNELEKSGQTQKTIIEENDMKYYTMGWVIYNSLKASKELN